MYTFGIFIAIVIILIVVVLIVNNRFSKSPNWNKLLSLSYDKQNKKQMEKMVLWANDWDKCAVKYVFGVKGREGLLTLFNPPHTAAVVEKIDEIIGLGTRFSSNIANLERMFLWQNEEQYEEYRKKALVDLLELDKIYETLYDGLNPTFEEEVELKV